MRVVWLGEWTDCWLVCWMDYLWVDLMVYMLGVVLG